MLKGRTETFLIYFSILISIGGMVGKPSILLLLLLLLHSMPRNLADSKIIMSGKFNLVVLFLQGMALGTKLYTKSCLFFLHCFLSREEWVEWEG